MVGAGRAGAGGAGAAIDTSVVLLALPHISAELHANSSEQRADVATAFCSGIQVAALVAAVAVAVPAVVTAVRLRHIESFGK